ncbi:efflux RND transporter permease subunit [Pseudomonas wadenswilerensis]|uniref:efflux RND transporter permease subunit n=1 Tax=Pseudomonas wadenswilerensis TaxID=1785161 RepID=UPI00320828A9
MNISRFFIDRPIFAGVLSAIIFIAGLISIFNLPVSEYPEVAPPSVVVKAQYPGAHPQTIAETVATPIEEQINGVEGMLYMNSHATADGQLTLTVTFRLGTDPDLAQQRVQNRVNQALPRLPEPVQRLGVTTVKSAPDLTMVVHLRSPNERYDMQYLRNYALLNVKDRLARINGIGQVQVAGSGDYAMRIWLDPRKLAARNLAPGDVVQALREQNVNAAAGVIGAAPAAPGVDYQISVNASGRLNTEEAFREVIVRTSADGRITRLRDVARVELAAGEYALRTLVDNKQATALLIYQLPGANALQISDDVRKAMVELKQAMPEGVDYQVIYDPTQFVRASIDAVIHTLLEAILLVVVVVIVFLQTWRASIIPLLAVPVSVVGTFAVMLAMGFSINALSLFGLVLAIGVVVDDAIVVVENVERNIGLGLSPREATYQAMREVSGPIVAIALTLCAVFVPLAFVSGLSGQFFKQFALTIAISTVISAFNSLTLSPALAAMLLKGHEAPKDGFQRVFDRLFGGFFVRFNRLFGRASDHYGTGVSRILKRKSAALLVYALLAVAAVLIFNRVPTGFVPPQDKQYLVGFVQLPDAASLDRTESVLREMTTMALDQPGVDAVTGYAGWSINGFVSSPNSGVAFFVLKDFAERKGPGMTGNEIAAQLNTRFVGIKGAYTAVFAPPPVSGLGSVGGFKLQLQDRAALGNAALDQGLQAFMAEARKAPELAGLFSSFQINVPQLHADVDRTRAQQLGVSIPAVFEALQIYLGSIYVNDFNKFGRTFQVKVQADAQFRGHAEDIGLLKTRNVKGEMVPLASLLTLRQSYGPDQAMRYNGFPSADVSGAPAPGYSSGQALQAVERIAERTLPRGIGYEWTEITYQDKMAGNTLIIILPLAMLLVFFVLAAQYESLSLPLAVLLIVPMGILSAITGVWLAGGDNNLFTQISFVVLVGLACKNAILIVEFAHELEHQGRSIRQAAIEAARLRLRPILMTSIAFIAGVVPLILSSGAGAEMRQAMGIAVFTGMIGVTVFGLFLTPVFYVLLRHLSLRFTRRERVAAPPTEGSHEPLGRQQTQEA